MPILYVDFVDISAGSKAYNHESVSMCACTCVYVRMRVYVCTAMRAYVSPQCVA